MVINEKEIIAADIYQWREFKKWVEQTSLFNALLKDSGTNTIIEYFSKEEVFSMQLNFKRIAKFEQLPPELLIKFYQNSPWFANPHYRSIGSGDELKDNNHIGKFDFESRRVETKFDPPNLKYRDEGGTEG